MIGTSNHHGREALISMTGQVDHPAAGAICGPDAKRASREPVGLIDRARS